MGEDGKMWFDSGDADLARFWDIVEYIRVTGLLN